MSSQDSAINWRIVVYTIAGCWLIFGLMLVLLGEKLAVFLNPLPILIKAIFGGLIYGYVGGTKGWNAETIFVYWTLVGIGLSWLLHKKINPAVIIIVAAVLHVILSVLSLLPMMLIGGR